MGNLRLLLSLLLVSLALLLLNGSSADSQTLTTLTSTPNATLSTQVTVYSTIQSTSTATEPVSYSSWPFDYSASTNTFSLRETHTIFVASFFFGDSEDIPCEYYDYFVFNATTGQEITGQFASEPAWPMGFYVLSSAQLRRFNSSGCVIGEWGWKVYEFGPAGEFNWTVPETDQYTFLFLSRDFYGGQIHFTAQAYSAVETSSLSTYVVTSTYAIPSAEILVSTQTAASAVNSTHTNEVLPAAIIIIAILILVVGLFAKARRRSLRWSS